MAQEEVKIHRKNIFTFLAKLIFFSSLNCEQLKEHRNENRMERRKFNLLTKGLFLITYILVIIR